MEVLYWAALAVSTIGLTIVSWRIFTGHKKFHTGSSSKLRATVAWIAPLVVAAISAYEMRFAYERQMTATVFDKFDFGLGALAGIIVFETAYQLGTVDWELPGVLHIFLMSSCAVSLPWCHVVGFMPASRWIVFGALAGATIHVLVRGPPRFET